MPPDPRDRPKLRSPRGRWLGRLTEPLFLFPAFAFIGLALIWGATDKVIRVERAGAERAAAASTLELVDTYESQVVRAIREIDQTLKVVKYAYEAGDRHGALESLRAKELLPYGLIFTVSITDRDGEVVASTRPFEKSNVAGQDTFAQARLHDDLAIGLPQPSATAGEWTLVFGRRLDAPDGGFAGIVTLSVDASYFVSGYEQARLGDHGMLGVLGTDGVFRVRRSGIQVRAGDAVDYAAGVPELDAEAVVAIERDPDGIRRYRSARPLYGLPLAVVVGLSVEEVLAPVDRQAQIHRLRAGALSALLIVFAGALGRMSWQLAQIRRRENEERLAHAQRVEYLAYHDSLTTLPNRSLFARLLEQGLQQAQRHRRKLALLFLDLDRFKHINDTLGHEAGDQLLQEVAQRIQACLRESDTVARVGGDEFVVLLREVGERKHIAAVARKLLDAVAEPFVLHGQECGVGVSIGIAIYPDDGQDEQTLTTNADSAMYQAKVGGRNGFRFYAAELNATADERMLLEARLRDALDRREFRLHYQPKRDAVSGRITGLEALLRWEHPELGTVAPAEFLGVAEEAGLLPAIGRWALGEACRQNVAWQSQGLSRVSVALNLSAQQFARESLMSDVATILEETGMSAELLELEVDETILMRDVESAMVTLGRLRELGIRVAIDRFGVGYSSLANLGRFPIDTIKIDRSCIRSIVESSGDRKLTDAIIALGRVLSLNVIGHGVETQGQAELLREQACPELQGYYFDRPLPPAEFAKLLEQEGP